MEKYVKKYFWTINLLTIAICAFLAAKSTNTFLGGYLADMGTPVQTSVTPTEAPKPKKNTEVTEYKAKKNPFTGEEIAPQASAFDPEKIIEASTTENPADFSEDTECNATSIPGTLVATIASTNPENSFAMIENSEKKIGLYEISQEYQPGVSIVAVVRHKVFLNNQGRIECMFHGEEPEKKAKTEAKEEGGDGVRKVDENTYVISQDEKMRQLENLNQLATQARIVPSFKNGQSNGFRIYSIKSGSLFQKIGLKNGDVLQNVNGMEINSPEKALEIYSKLKEESRIRLDVLRRGQKTSMDYTFQ